MKGTAAKLERKIGAMSNSDLVGEAHTLADMRCRGLQRSFKTRIRRILAEARRRKLSVSLMCEVEQEDLKKSEQFRKEYEARMKEMDKPPEPIYVSPRSIW